MSTTQRIAQAGAFLPGFSPDQLQADPILGALAGRRRLRLDQLLDLASCRVPAARPRKQNARRAPALAAPAFPLLQAFQAVKGGSFLPDAVVDTESKREADSVCILKRLQILAALYPDGLRFYRITLSALDGYFLYDPAAVEIARKYVEKWLKARGLRGEWKLERGREGGTHVHIVTCASAGPGGVGVYDLAGLACYLAKPADGRACLPKRSEKGMYTAAELRRQKDEAAEYWLQAEQARVAGKFGKRDRLPRLRSRACS